ncbi:MAG: OmpA family protein [Deltaproteobacteria bacterium]|nr:OmpA family protein [Deltaproteobacteria bacterium]
MGMRALITAAVLSSAAALGTPAFAQSPIAGVDGFDAHGFGLVAQDGDPRDLMTVQRAGRFNQGEFWFSTLTEFAKAPLVLGYHYPDGRPDEYENVLDNVLALNLSTGVAVHNYIRLDVAFPMYLTSTGYDGSNGFNIGDTRVTVTGAIIRPKPVFGGGFGLAVMPHLDIPSGNDEVFLGKGGVGYGGKLAATYEARRITVSADAGANLGPSIDSINLSANNQIVFGGGFGLMLTPTIGANFEFRYGMEIGDNDVKGTASPSEVIGSVRGRMMNGLHWNAGAAAALTNGVGAARWRAFLGIGWGKIDTNFGDWDNDGIGDEDDECFREDETYNKYQDEDGCPDEGGLGLFTVQLDGFMESEVPITVTDGVNEWNEDSKLDPVAIELPAGSYKAKAGYPGYAAETQFVISAGEQPVMLDLQMVVPGSLSVSLTHAQGGSLDKVGFSVIGEGAPPGAQVLGPAGLDRMELPPGQYLIYLKTNDGALFRKYIRIATSQNTHVDALLRNPRVVITPTKVEVNETIYFDTNQATIKQESFDLLEELGTLIIANPQVGKIDIQGHTDDQGSDSHNLELSQNRATAVMEYLIGVGVEQGRLTSMGFGETLPIATNDTEEGRAINRRVEFLIVGQN